MATPRYGQPQDPRNPFANPRQQPPAQSYAQPRREYDADSDMGDHYGSVNGSTTRLAGSPAYYEQNGQLLFLNVNFLKPGEYCAKPSLRSHSLFP